MFSRLFHALDDFLIDRIFQPICDALRKLFGWTKEVLMGISFIAAAICFMPLCVFIFDDGTFIIAGWALIALIIWWSWFSARLIRKGTSKKGTGYTGSTTLDAARTILFVPRMALFVIVATMIPFLIWLICATPSVSFMLSAFTAGIIFAISVLYFQACTDLPPGKTIFAKAREWFARHSARPVSTPQ